ncbi:hypothetical protein M758_11G068800 [Ceratodon purpureus]|uniref:NmrA-like domain-containing protein n=1 Tax=Ceratodon purpureus TaxID=3225 RepID=A0A8T0GEB8_CERPU|nr:hypothetical protein KC19_11G070700 [Ceratodon purpureus]KAG0600893.1 hypothetical protein M758_11G068800 [Ceratodon purpureus]
MATPIILAGATGNLGGRIARALVGKGADVRALVRRGTAPERAENLRKVGVTVTEVDLGNVPEVAAACAGGTCVVSALTGHRDVIVDGQTALLEAAVEAGVPRFIPSDFALDFMKMPAGFNRNLDLRREFHERLDKAPIAATSILNGGFMELLSQAPIILFRFRRVLYWSDADQLLDFTTIDNTAAFTAAAALDPSTPRTLRIAGDQLSAKDLVALAGDTTGEKFKLLRGGSLARLETMIRVTRTLFPQEGQVYPAWQGMQYLHNMFSGFAKLTPLDNDRYTDIRWTTAREMLSAR